MEVFKKVKGSYFLSLIAILIIQNCTGISIFDPVSIKIGPHYKPVIIQLNVIEGRTDEVAGINIGVFNIVRRNLKGFQIGLFNACDEVDGSIFNGAIFRNSNCEITGFQIGITNTAYNTFGGQIGIWNLSRKKMHGTQLGLINLDMSHYGKNYIFQVGLLNICTSNDFFIFMPIINICN